MRRQEEEEEEEEDDMDDEEDADYNQLVDDEQQQQEEEDGDEDNSSSSLHQQQQQQQAAIAQQDAVRPTANGIRDIIRIIPPPPRAVALPPGLPPLPPAPCVIILRGVSGAGKSSLARHYQSLILAAAASSAPTSAAPLAAQSVICSADSYFFRNGVYRFDSKQLSQAHAACTARLLSLLSARSPHVVVDNTNIQRWEYDNQASIARLLGYSVCIIALRARGADEAAVCADRNVHDVPYSGVCSMQDRWEPDERELQLDAVFSMEERERMRQRQLDRAARAAAFAQQQQLRLQEQQQQQQQAAALQQHQQHQQQWMPGQPPLPLPPPAYPPHAPYPSQRYGQQQWNDREAAGGVRGRSERSSGDGRVRGSGRGRGGGAGAGEWRGAYRGYAAQHHAAYPPASAAAPRSSHWMPVQPRPAAPAVTDG